MFASARPDWEGFFLIGLFPAGEWCKVQLFSGGRHPRRHCFSAIEGMDGPAASATVLEGRAGDIAHHTRTLDELVHRHGHWDVRAPGLRWEGTLEGMDFHCDAPRVAARIRCQPDMLWWVRWRNIVAYWTAFGTLEWNGRRGVALVEHAWGRQTRTNLSRYAPRWHWDVLAFDDGSACAGLWSSLGPLRSGGRVPGQPFRRGGGLSLHRIDERRWKGRLHLGRGVMRYEAHAATPLSPTVPGGGMMGFVFDGGTGFTEFGHPR